MSRNTKKLGEMMNIHLIYYKEWSVPIESLCIQSEQLGNVFLEEREDGNWHLELMLPPGIYEFEYLINNELTLNNPLQSEYLLKDGRLLSYLEVDEEGKQVDKNQPYELQVKGCYLKKSYLSQEYVYYLEIGKMTGQHMVSGIWMNQDGKLMKQEHQLVGEADGNNSNQVVNFSFKRTEEDEGEYRVIILIDGKRIIEEPFVINPVSATKYLPIGTVVLLKGGEKTVMIYGITQRMNNVDKVYDYIGCLYPEGNLGQEMNVFFNQDQIEAVKYMGWETEEQREFNQYIVQEIEKQE